MKLFLIAATLLLATPQDTDKAKTPAADDAKAGVVAAQLPSYPLETCAVSGKELGTMGDPVEHVVDGHLVRLCCEGCIKKVDADPASYVKKVEEAVVRTQKPTYPLKTCPLTGKELGEDAVDNVVGTRLVRTCCGKCGGAIAKDATKAMTVVDKAYMDAQRPTYALKVCVVSTEELGSMGEPVEMLYGTRLVRLCCKGCKKEFAKDPKTYLAKLGGNAEKASDKAADPASDKGKGGL